MKKTMPAALRSAHVKARVWEWSMWSKKKFRWLCCDLNSAERVASSMWLLSSRQCLDGNAGTGREPIATSFSGTTLRSPRITRKEHRPNRFFLSLSRLIIASMVELEFRLIYAVTKTSVGAAVKIKTRDFIKKLSY